MILCGARLVILCSLSRTEYQLLCKSWTQTPPWWMQRVSICSFSFFKQTSPFVPPSFDAVFFWWQHCLNAAASLKQLFFWQHSDKAEIMKKNYTPYSLQYSKVQCTTFDGSWTFLKIARFTRSNDRHGVVLVNVGRCFAHRFAFVKIFCQW